MDKLVFPSDQSARLGLKDGESVRLLASGSKTILLERVDAEASDALPWDRDLVLTASVTSFSLADILHLVHASSKSGFLFFENGDHVKSVYLHRGEVIFATSNQKFDRLGECLVRSGAITPEQFAEAIKAYTPSSQFGRILVEREFLTSRELWGGVKLQVEEIVRSLFSYGSGSVLFWEGEVRPDNVVRLSLPTRRLIAQGLKRRDELLRFLAVLETPRVRITSAKEMPQRLGESERAMLDAIAGGGSFREQCHRAGVEPLCGARTVQQLRMIGAVTVTREEDSNGPLEADAAPSDDEAVRECVRLHAKLLAEFAAPIVAVEGEAGIRERLQRITEDAAQRYPELLSDLTVGPGGVLDPDVLIARALAYPGEREREVRLALGELVSYLEFELINHPGIDRPDEFLEDLEGLRSRL
ncbi:MAG: DUF4388 domain-containing protein [Deltaproteobacteria bacterium]|jgi:hypothetical protein|nr:DUF4388 domain-containing protein [Deltaproteobacteria bacterium]